MKKIQLEIKKGITKGFINAIANNDNDLVLTYLKNGMSATKECRGMLPLIYAINHKNFGAILLLIQYGATLEKEFLEYEEDSSKEALGFLASLVKMDRGNLF